MEDTFSQIGFCKPYKSDPYMFNVCARDRVSMETDRVGKDACLQPLTLSARTQPICSSAANLPLSVRLCNNVTGGDSRRGTAVVYILYFLFNETKPYLYKKNNNVRCISETVEATEGRMAHNKWPERHQTPGSHVFDTIPLIPLQALP